MLTQYLWFTLAFLVLHVIEEIWSSFLTWYRGLLPQFVHAINIPWYTVINTLLVTYGLIAVNWGTGPLEFRLSFPALLFVNALIHIVVAIRRRSYNPGLLTCIFLYLPGIFLLFRHAVLNGVSGLTILYSFLIGIGFHSLLPLTLLVSNIVATRFAQEGS